MSSVTGKSRFRKQPFVCRRRRTFRDEKRRHASPSRTLSDSAFAPSAAMFEPARTRASPDLAAKAERVRREAAERAAADLHGGGTPESPSPPDEPSSPVETQSCLANPAFATPPPLGVALPVREPVAPEATPPVPALPGPTVPTPAKTLRYERSVAGQTVGLEPKDVIQVGDKMLIVRA